MMYLVFTEPAAIAGRLDNEATDAAALCTGHELKKLYGVGPVTLKALMATGNGLALVWDRAAQQHVLVEEDAGQPDVGRPGESDPDT